MPEGPALDQRLRAWRHRIDRVLDAALPGSEESPQSLHAGMRHAVLLGGKRIRPLLVYATGSAFAVADEYLDAPAAAVELVQAYSLVHDDLPAMDDDALRRGQPTVHVAYGEAVAILVGDALQSFAFEVLAGAGGLPAPARVAMLAELARAAGSRGMCAGQALDLAATGGGMDMPVAQLEALHARKTGALLRAAVRMGAIAGRADAGAHAHLDRFAHALGLAFQVRDDLLDVEGDSATLGKTAGKDAAQGKATYPALVGIDGSRIRLDELSRDMHAALAPFGDRAQPLRAIARQVVERSH